MVQQFFYSKVTGLVQILDKKSFITNPTNNGLVAMSKTLALTLVLVFLTASSAILAMPVSGASIAENTWTTKAPMHVARSDLGVAVVNGKNWTR